jgi:hypothetical protein
MTETHDDQDLDRLLAGIAREHLSIPTLTTRGSDARDFHEVAAWTLKEALRAAYEAGRQAPRPTVTTTYEEHLLAEGWIKVRLRVEWDAEGWATNVDVGQATWPELHQLKQQILERDPRFQHLRAERGCEFCRQGYNRRRQDFTCPYCQTRWAK